VVLDPLDDDDIHDPVAVEIAERRVLGVGKGSCIYRRPGSVGREVRSRVEHDANPARPLVVDEEIGEAVAAHVGHVEAVGDPVSGVVHRTHRHGAPSSG